MGRIPALVAAFAAAGLFSAPAEAAQRVSWQALLEVPAHLANDGTGLVDQVPGSIQRGHAAGVPYSGRWANLAVAVDSTTQALRRLERQSRRGGSAHAALIDRPLRPAERRTFDSRALFYDADVLLVAPSNPACARGLSPAEARTLLRGTRARWSELVAWSPSPAGDLVVLAVPARLPVESGGAVPLFGVTRYASSARVVAEAIAVRVLAGSAATWAVGAAWSAARDVVAAGGACAPAIDGVAPSDASVRALRLPTAYPAALAWAHRRPRGFAGLVRSRFLREMRGARVRAYLGREAGRRRILP